MRHLKYFENIEYGEPKYLGSLWSIFLDKPHFSATDIDIFKNKNEVWKYRDIYFAWNKEHVQYCLVYVVEGKWDDDVEKEIGMIQNYTKMKINMGDTFKEVKHKVDKYHFDKELNKYNL